MRAVVYQEPYKVTVEQMPDPTIEAPTDAVVRITTTNVCGSDLHACEGRTPAEPGFVFGHENMGIVEEVGSGVSKVQVGNPGAPAERARQGYYRFPMGLFRRKGLTPGTGQANVKKYDRCLRDLIVAGRAVPGQIVSHELPLDEAPDAYDKFDKRIDGYTKVVLKPGMSA